MSITNSQLFVPRPHLEVQYYRYRRDRTIFKALCMTDLDEEARAAFEDGKPVLSGFAMKVDWATGEREFIFSKRIWDIEKRNAVIEAMTYPNKIENCINNSDHPTIIYRQLLGGYPHPQIRGQRGYYQPPQPKNE